MTLSLEDTWIKAAVEHRVINIDYFSIRTKREYTKRDVEPDYMGASKNGFLGLWATWCHLRSQGPRCFKPDSVKRFSITYKTFSPSPDGRWEELIPIYEQKGLKVRVF